MTFTDSGSLRFISFRQHSCSQTSLMLTGATNSLIPASSRYRACAIDSRRRYWSTLGCNCLVSFAAYLQPFASSVTTEALQESRVVDRACLGLMVESNFPLLAWSAPPSAYTLQS